MMRRAWAGLGAALLLGLAGAAAGWVATDRLEQDDDFCNACHLEPGVPLHAEIRRDFTAPAPRSLAAAHAREGNAARADGAFRCIDCHGGVGALGRARVKLLAAKDAFWYLVGSFEEPETMRWPLWDRDCTRCHASFSESEPPLGGSPAFHQLAVHNVELGVDCVECHRVHLWRDVATEAAYLHVRHVRGQCARCHPGFEEEAP